MAKSNFIVRGGADFSGIKKELTKTQKQLQGFKSSVNKTMKTIGTILGSLAIGKLIKDSTQMAMGVETAIQNINHNMGQSAEAFQNWVETQSKSLGMAKADAYEYGSIFSNLLSSFTSGAQETADQTQELMKAAAIIASRTGRTYDDVANRIRSGMLGSTEAIEDLGVYTNISMIESTEAFRRFAGDRSWSQLDFQLQQQIRLAAILEQTYKRYGDTLADNTQLRQAQFIASLKNIQLSLGQAFLPIYNAVLPALTVMADAIGRVVNLIAQFTTALFGAPKTIQNQTKSIQSQAGAMKDLGAATTGAGKAAKKAAKDAKGALAPFDEINQLADKTGASSGAGGAGAVGGGGGAAIEMPTMDTGGFASSVVEVSEKVKEMTAKIKTYLEPAIAALGRLKDAFMPLGQNIASGLKWILDNVLIPLGKWTITEVVPRFIDALANVFRILNEVVEALKPLWSWLWENLFLPVAQWTGGVILDILDGINKGLTAIGDWISENQKTVETLAIIVGSFAAAWGLVNAAITIWNVVAGIATGITNGLAAAIAFLTSPIGIAIAIIGALIAAGVLLWKNWDKVKEWAIKLWDKIKEVFGNIGRWIGDVWNNIKNWTINTWNNIKTFLANLWNSLIGSARSIFSNVWNTIKNIFSSVGSWFGSIFRGAWNNVKNAFSGVASFFQGIWNTIKNMFTTIGTTIGNAIGGAFKNVVNSIIRFAENTINGFIRAINTAIKVINLIPGVNIRQLSTLRIPKLATGTNYVPEDMLAIIHEGEAVIPKEFNPYAGGQGMIGNDRPIELTLQIGETKLGRIVIDSINKLQKQEGRILLEL